MFAGRIDNQVKIRGLRVELGEIEAALTAHDAVAQAVVTVVTDAAGMPQLAGYLRPADPGAVPDPGELRQHLAARLPGYMVPTYLTVLEEFPLTANGKISKAALPAPQAIAPGGERAEPRTLLEAVLVDLYASVLGHEQAGAADSFFDAGGNSLAGHAAHHRAAQHAGRGPGRHGGVPGPGPAPAGRPAGRRARVHRLRPGGLRPRRDRRVRWHLTRR